MSEDFREFWRDDFNCLKHAGRLITEAMRRDEQTLEDRINSGHNPSSHLYFAAEQKESPLQFDRRIPLPRWLIDKSPTRHFRMGLWSEAELAWAIFEDTVYIWNFLVEHATPYVFSTMDKQPIIAVGLVPPKKGVFVENIKWCLVVTTIECVFLSALYRSDSEFSNHGQGNSGSHDALLLIANVFKISSDDVRLTVIAGSRDGRIFLGGDNGAIYAIDYDGEVPDDSLDAKLKEFYDGNLELGSVVSDDSSLTGRLRKRVMESLSYGSARKCRKVDMGNAREGYYTLSNLFFRNGDGVERLIVDEDRGFLVALTKSGHLSIRNLGAPSVVVKNLNVMETAETFLGRIGRRAEPVTHQAAVGGHDMARNIAKRGHDLLRPVAIHGISKCESQKYFLVIVTSGGLRLFFSTSPNNVLSLSHIRGAQPLLKLHNANLELDTTGGYLPSISDCSVTAAHYRKGLLLAAYANPGDSSSSLVASGPDCQLRKMKQNGKEFVQVPGGITESIAYPLGEAKLSGNDIWDIGEIDFQKQPKSLQLLSRYSGTPTDQDLRRPTLPQPFSFPKHQNMLDATSSAVLDLFGRPKRNGRSKEKGVRYCLSKRSAVAGFSNTAAENRNFSSSSTQQRFKLKSWLLHPRDIALQFMAAQYPPDESQVIVLNADGFHVFSKTSPIKQFEQAISRRDGKSFFNKFLRRECCSMGLALSMGLCSETRIQDQAKELVWGQGMVPTLELRSGETGNKLTTAATTNADDSLVPLGYEFRPSPLFEGLKFLLSRLLRPVWHKALVVVTEGPLVKQAGVPSVKHPAKVELLLDETATEGILVQLSRLQELLSRRFGHAIETVPGMVNPNSDKMEVDENTGASFLLNNHQGMNTLAQTIVLLQPAEAEKLSRKLEDRNVHALYRTISRSCQLIKLLSLLRNQRQMSSFLRIEKAEVQWGMLHGITFSEFVESSEGQDRLEGLLNSLVAKTQRRSREISSQAVEEFTRYLSENCYYFFPLGSQYACMGHQLVARALAYGDRAKNFEDLCAKAVRCFLDASHHWRNPGLITGRTTHATKTNSNGDLAHTAEINGSPLALAVSALLALRDVVSVAKVCLQVAANFQRRTSTHSVKLAGSSRPVRKWEELLYHHGQLATDVVVANGIQQPKQALARSEVTGEDAVATCYGLIFNTLSKLLNSQRNLADSMLSFCLSWPDKMFRDKLFEFLLEGNTDVLLSIDSTDLQEWLEANKDMYLLWRYLNLHGKRETGGKLALDIASDRSERLALETRIEWLERSVASFGELIRANDRSVNFHKKDAVAKLQVARLQQRIVRTMQSQLMSQGTSQSEAENMENAMAKLKDDLLPVSELYNDFAAAWGMAEECLRIFHACNQNKSPEEETNRLWRLLICGELLPCETRQADIFQYLTAIAADFQLDDQITLLQGRDRSSQGLFEDCLWADKFRNRIVVLGKELYRPSESSVFPIEYLLRIFEDLRRLVDKNHFSPSWSLVTFVDAGVPVLAVLKAFDSLVHEPTGLALQVAQPESNSVDKVTAKIELIEHVLSNDISVERDRLLLELDSIRAKLDHISMDNALSERLGVIYSRIRPGLFH